MNLATDSAPLSSFFRRLISLGVSLTFCALEGGCASFTSLRDHSTALASTFWGRPSRSLDAQSYDLYAESMAAARKPSAIGLVPASAGSSPMQKEGSATLSGQDKVTQVEQSRSSSTGTRNRERSEDATVRVTLGRPESLPTLAKPGDALAPVLASAAATNWKHSRKNLTDALPLAVTRHRTTVPSRTGQESPDRLSFTETRTPSHEDELQTILARAKDRLDAISTYQVNISRIERIGGNLQPEEEAILSIRRKPKAVRLEWPKGPNKGREVIYSSALDDRMMYVNMGNPSLPITRMTIPVDSPLALRNSRHAITEAGFDTIFENLFKSLRPSLHDVAASGKLVYKGVERPKGLDQPCHLLERVTPQGETWQVYLDTRTLMPAVVLAYHSRNELIERYIYRNLHANPVELAAGNAFDPDQRWGEPKNWLSRLARATTSPADASSGQAATR
jgi:hypothetical protein